VFFFAAVFLFFFLSGYMFLTKNVLIKYIVTVQQTKKRTIKFSAQKKTELTE